MANKWKKRAAALLSALLAVVLTCGAAFAAGELDLSRKGSVSVTLRNSDGDAVSGGSLTLYQVAEVESGSSGLSFAYTEDFAGCGYSLSDLSSRSLAEKLAKWAEDCDALATRSLGEDGKVTFSSLPLGLYLLVQEEAPEDYEAISPFLVTVPLQDEDGYVYDVDASPKAETYTGAVDVKVKKVWNDGKDTKSRPSSISVTLYRGSETVETVTLSEKNDWSYTWTELKKSDEYSVREADLKGYKATYSQDGYTFTITNTPKLPQTGQLNWPVPVLAACGLLLFGLGWGLKRSGRRNENENW